MERDRKNDLSFLSHVKQMSRFKMESLNSNELARMENSVKNIGEFQVKISIHVQQAFLKFSPPTRPNVCTVPSLRWAKVRYGSRDRIGHVAGICAAQISKAWHDSKVF